MTTSPLTVALLETSLSIAFFLSALDNDKPFVSPHTRAHVNAALADGEVWGTKVAEDDSIVGAALLVWPCQWSGSNVLDDVSLYT